MTEIAAYDVVVVGAGPAGLAAASVVAESGARVAIVDDNPTLGGQIWRGQQRHPTNALAARWIDRARSLPIERLTGTQIVAIDDDRRLICEAPDGGRHLRWQRLILATGARERFLPFPGWTLPGVMGAGGLQSLAKSGLPIAGKSIVVAGSGPLLLAVAAYFVERGAHVPLIAEQTTHAKLWRFGKSLYRYPGKAIQAVALRRSLRAAPYHTDCWPLSVVAENEALRVRLNHRGYIVTQSCDYLACGFGLTPNVELAALLGCEIDADRVTVDDLQQTSACGVLAAGEVTGIGGVDLAILEGQIAGHAAMGDERRARRLIGKRRRARGFAQALEAAFSLRDELRDLPRGDTIVCRCEDVRYEPLSHRQNSRDAKLQTRCGMGPCQGRVCGPATEFLFGWRPGSIRPPIHPTTVGNLVDACRVKE